MRRSTDTDTAINDNATNHHLKTYKLKVLCLKVNGLNDFRKRQNLSIF